MNFVIVDAASWNSMLDAISRIDRAVAKIAITVNATKTEEDRIMSAISDAVAALTTKAGQLADTEDAALVVLNGLRDQLASAIANASDAAAAVANVQQVIAGMDAHNAPLAAAIATPPAP